MKGSLLTIVIVVIALQDAISQNRSRYEWYWAMTHPVAAIRIQLMSKKCYKMYALKRSEGNPDTFSNGGKLDAYRHVFFMAVFAQKIKQKKLIKLGEAHEKGNYRQFKHSQKEDGEIPDSLSSVMDLHNNKTGIELGRANKKLNRQELELYVLKAINEGKALIMKRNKNGMYLNCEEQPLDLKFYQKVWNVPKCLVSSDFVYK